jgi:hypothetical protein
MIKRASWEGKHMAAYRALVALALITPQPVVADELPKELLFQCEGKMNAVLDAAKSQTRTSTFRINLRLRDGVIVDAQTGLVEGAECVQENGEIKCKVTKLYPQANSVIKRFSTVVINRNTRELTHWLESWDYQGTEASGTPTAHLRVLRTGICRDDVLF